MARRFPRAAFSPRESAFFMPCRAGRRHFSPALCRNYESLENFLRRA